MNFDYCFFNSESYQNRFSITCSSFSFKFFWMLVFVSFATDLKAQNVVVWPQFDIPPLFMSQKDGSFAGAGPAIIDYIKYNMPEYEHKDALASPVKIIQEIQLGRGWVATGLLKTPDREKYLIFSKYPCRLIWWMMAVIRADDRKKMVANGEINPENLLSSGKYKLGYIKGVNYGPLNPVIDRYRKTENTSYPSRDFKNQISLLLKKRIDIFFANPLIVYYTSEYQGTAEKIAMFNCKGFNKESMLGYFAAPRNRWGREVIKRIDQILEAGIRSGELKDILANWVPINLKSRFDREYKIHFEGSVLSSEMAH